MSISLELRWKTGNLLACARHGLEADGAPLDPAFEPTPEGLGRFLVERVRAGVLMRPELADPAVLETGFVLTPRVWVHLRFLRNVTMTAEGHEVATPMPGLRLTTKNQADAIESGMRKTMVINLPTERSAVLAADVTFLVELGKPQ